MKSHVKIKSGCLRWAPRDPNEMAPVKEAWSKRRTTIACTKTAQTLRAISGNAPAGMHRLPLTMAYASFNPGRKSRHRRQGRIRRRGTDTGLGAGFLARGNMARSSLRLRWVCRRYGLVADARSCALTSLTISGPVRALTLRARRLAEGSGQSLTPLGFAGTAEIAELSQSLFTMARSLQQRSDYIVILRRARVP